MMEADPGPPPHVSFHLTLYPRRGHSLQRPAANSIRVCWPRDTVQKGKQKSLKFL